MNGDVAAGRTELQTMKEKQSMPILKNRSIEKPTTRAQHLSARVNNSSTAVYIAAMITFVHLQLNRTRGTSAIAV